MNEPGKTDPVDVIAWGKMTPAQLSNLVPQLPAEQQKRLLDAFDAEVRRGYADLAEIQL